jgi:hypothetical protein
MSRFVGEPKDFVLDAGTIPSPHPLDDTGEERGTIHCTPNDLVGSLVGVSDVAGHLGQRRPFASIFKGKERGRNISPLDFETRVVDGPAVKTRTSPGLETSQFET